jgi:pyruvate,orthophosphate dikinase
MEQLWGAVGAVFGSWRNARAETYRRLNNIPESWGTAVNVQAMVFGNLGPTSATGVAFTRNPSTGENALYGEFLVNAQGEDVVAGIRTPQNLTKIAREDAGSDMPSMEEVMPEVFNQLVDVNLRLENHYRDMQDIEFTVQDGKLWMLQTRSGKRTTAAALKIAVDMVAEGLITKDEAVLRIDPMSLDQLLHPMLDPDAEFDIIATGLPASPGAASGAVVFSADEAEKAKADGRKVILVRMETSPEDIHGMHAAEGILTSRGGMTSHAAVVARGMGRPCVSGAGSVRIDYEKQEFQVAGVKVTAGETITLDGGTGRVMAGEVPTRQPELSGDFANLIAWADEIRRMRVRTNAETPADAATAVKFGAEGIGLCRTEHMFFDANRIMAVREMILAENLEDRAKPLERILPMQRDDFTELFTIMTGMPVTIRLLDPPLHEFLPQHEEDVLQVADAIGMTQDKLKRRIRELEEVNPMLGHRGCRMGLTYPEIYEMQARAIFEAAISVAKTTGSTVVPEVMIPLVADHSELKELADRIEAIAQNVIQEQNAELDYLIGTMIELPRAALRAADIAQTAKFFSFGTNDLTQTTFGISRDDAASFMEPYLSRGLFEYDPFVSLDQDGVGELVQLAAERGRSARADLKLGICGEHGGDPASIAFCEKTGLDYVSCSPYRVPIARLAAAQSYLRTRK